MNEVPMIRQTSWCAIVLALAVACTDPMADEDAGRVDAGRIDAGRVDAGPGIDGGPVADAGPREGHYFPPGSFFLDDVSSAPVAATSDEMIQALRDRGGWG